MIYSARMVAGLISIAKLVISAEAKRRGRIHTHRGRWIPAFAPVENRDGGWDA
jgi:hypothetical protein